ncbi:MAG: methyltransferase domain-containing protein [Firmicutes bacterium]|nr:methyltransferase domain-containing protein [Bacillota bacterium]
MKFKYLVNAMDLAKNLIEEKVKRANVVLDATVGNGNDTLFLAKLVGEKGKVYGFDIQRQAINSTKEILIENNVFDRVKLIEDSHANIDIYVKEGLDLIIFNLGYLPGGNHNIITKPKSTLAAIEKGLNKLNDNGILLIVGYPGHKGGNKEIIAVKDYLKGLNQKHFTVIRTDFINQVNNPPILFAIEKKN